jgi:hypothetical protein
MPNSTRHIRAFTHRIQTGLAGIFKTFPGSEEYWKRRYESGGTSGAGSYREYATYKAGILNAFVREHNVRSVIEYGCGDGNQLLLSQYPSYIGFDVSPAAVSLCMETFKNDPGKAFKLMDEYAHEQAELTLSLDVIYHLVEDPVFHAYMNRLFESSTRYVGIYSSDTDLQARFQAPHVKHRKFTRWIEHHRPDWNLIRHLPALRASKNNDATTEAQFFFYEKSRGK